MTTPAITVREDALLHEVAEVLAAQRVSGLPVVDRDGSLVGVISEADIILKESGEPSEARTAGEAMSAPPLTIEPWHSLTEAARIMLQEHVNRLPVLSDGALVGIVTRADLVRAFVRSDAEITAEIHESVALRSHGIDPNGLTLSVHDGEVKVDGPLRSAADAELVEQVIRRIPGVVSVECRLGADTLSRD
jgi:signal-transduction protein with cAMP-binding, CBS, and nucleotidyltransferase domain